MKGGGTLQQLPQIQGHPLVVSGPIRYVRVIAYALAVGIAYFLAARLSLFLIADPDGVAVFWPAAGVSAGILIAMGPSALWPVVAGTMVATIVANLSGDRDVWSSIVFALANAGEAVLAAWLIRHHVGSDLNLGRLRHVFALLAAAIVSTAISGIGGTLGFVLFYNPSTNILITWLHWFLSDAVGIITVAPLAVGIAAAWRDPPPRNEILEGIAAVALVAAASVVLVVTPLAPWKAAFPVALLFPLLLWPSARCRPAFASAAIFVVSLLIVWAITFGLGQFGVLEVSMNARVVNAQATILGVALCALVVAALFSERRDHEIALEDSEARLQEALAIGGVTTFEWDLRSGLSRRSANADQILGLASAQASTASSFLARVHSDDRAHLKALIRGLHPNNPSYAVTFRLARPDGREVWLEEFGRAEFDDAGRLKSVKGLTIDVTSRKRAEEHQNILMAELDHRVKNVLARVSVVAGATRRGSRSMDELVGTLDGRIRSMALAHNLLSESRWLGVGLRNLVRNQLAPYAMDAVTISGVDAVLSPATTQALAMVLHELVTNAAKYGGLSTPLGRVSVSWEQIMGENGERSLMILWQERGGPPVAAEPTRSGFGTTLVRELIPHELGGTVDLVWTPDGAHCKMVIPMGRA